MAQYNTNLQLNKLKSGIKNETEETLKIPSNVVDGSNNEHNFSHKLLSTNNQVLRLCKAFANGSSANIKLSKTQLGKRGQPGGYLGRFIGPLLIAGLPLIGNVFKTLAKSVLIPLGITPAVDIQEKVFESGNTTLIIFNEDMNNTMKIIRSLVDYLLYSLVY